MRTDLSGRGIVNILAADQLILKPRLYSSFLLWLLSELFENLPEVGDLDKPKLVFFFDEAHLLFDDAPPALRQRVEQVVRLIRSKGVGVYFCSQFPDDVPNEILGQLGNRIQHALRAYTPRDQKAVQDRRRDLRRQPEARRRRGHLAARRRRGAGVHAPGEGRADAGGAHADLPAALPDGRDHARGAGGRAGAQPGRRQVRHAGQPRVGLRDPEQAGGRQDTDRTGASRAPVADARPGRSQPAAPAAADNPLSDLLWGTKRRQGMVETMAKQAARTVGSQLGRQILRGVLGGILGASRRS